MRFPLINFMYVLLALAIYIFIRNIQVYTYRTKMLKAIVSASIWDYQWRMDIMNTVSYHKMVLVFWKSLDSFYPDKAFLDLKDVRGFSPFAQPERTQHQEIPQT